MTASPGRLIGSIIWAASPVLTIGLGTPITFGIAAFRRKTIWMWLSFAFYAFALFLVLIKAGSTTDSYWVHAWMVASLLIAPLQAFAIRELVWYKPRPVVASEPESGS